MKTNMGNVDRSVRILAAVVIVALYFSGVITGTLGILLMVLSIVFTLTSFVGFCPLYFPFGFSTRGKKNSA